MKKLILLAVVVFGFAASSFAQKQAGVGVQGQINLPPAANASFWIGALNDLDFGVITNKATGPLLSACTGAPDNAAGILLISPDGTATPNAYITATSSRAAKFLIKGADTPVVLTDIDVNPKVSHGSHVWFDTDKTATYVDVNANGLAGQYVIRVGGLLTIDSQASGSISVPAITVIIANH